MSFTATALEAAGFWTIVSDFVLFFDFFGGDSLIEGIPLSRSRIEYRRLDMLEFILSIFVTEVDEVGSLKRQFSITTWQ